MSSRSRVADKDLEPIFADIYRAVEDAIRRRLELIGVALDGKARTLARDEQIRDKGDFIAHMGYSIRKDSKGFLLQIGSNAAHADYVLGGKVPSPTPLKPLISWVERKKLSWVDKKTKKELTVKQIARLVQHKIYKKGIKARNIYAEVLKNQESWIFSQLIKIGEGK